VLGAGQASAYNPPVQNKKPRSVLGLVFLTVFLDIVGFSVIFPLFPDMLEYYLGREGEASLIGRLVAFLGELADGDEFAVTAFFGGVLGSVYSLLQFVFAPVWGGLSDRIGRRPTLIVTLVGTVVGYALWIVSDSFALLIASRVLNGIAAGNISTASAAVADSTSAGERAKGMGIVGMAIGLGFVLGPAIGGFFAQYDLSGGADSWLHPFTAAAIASTVLGLANLLWVVARFRETLPPEKRGSSSERPGLNPLGRLAQLDYPGVKRINLLYLVYLTAFAAIEFTLTFLAKERFDYEPWDMAKMFVFVGLTIAFVQGGLVRRLAPRLGEKKVSLAGLVLTLPGFVAIGLARDTTTLYVGLAFMAVGSALAMPCLSALVSRYTPAERQGLSLGVFRSMGSLSRAIGPVLGGALFWRFGSESPYLTGAICLTIPIVMALGLPPVPETETSPEHA
jgi:MFS family permease